MARIAGAGAGVGVDIGVGAGVGIAAGIEQAIVDAISIIYLFELLIIVTSQVFILLRIPVTL